MTSIKQHADKVAGYFFKRGEKFTEQQIKEKFFPKRKEKFMRQLIKHLQEPTNKYRVVMCLDHNDYGLESSFFVKGVR